MLLHSYASLAALTSLSVDTLQREVRAGRLRPTRIRTCVRFTAQEVERWIDSSRYPMGKIVQINGRGSLSRREAVWQARALREHVRGER